MSIPSDLPQVAAVDLPSSRHPFELFTLALCGFVGVPLLLGEARPNSIASLLTPAQGDVWGAMLCLGALIALVGIFWKQRVTGIVLEQIGLVAVGGATIFYGIVVIAARGLEGAYAALFVFGFGISCIWRYFQLARYLRALRRVVTD